MRNTYYFRGKNKVEAAENKKHGQAIGQSGRTFLYPGRPEQQCDSATSAPFQVAAVPFALTHGTPVAVLARRCLNRRRQLLFLFRRIVHDHKVRVAVRTLPFEKNLFIRGVHNKLNVAMWAFDLTMVEFHMPDIFFLCGRHRGRYLVSENSGPADLLRTFMQQANRAMLTAVLLMSRFRMQHTAL